MDFKSKMSTRGFIGIRNNKKLIDGRFNHWDSYYDKLGEEVLGLYFEGQGPEIISLADNQDQDLTFLYDSLFCEYAYIYNIDNDTLEIYRGFFKKRQAFSIPEKMINSLEDDGKEKWFTHLILIIDRNKVTIEQVKKAFKSYIDRDRDYEKAEEDDLGYPEHKVIKLQIPEGYVMLV